MTNDRASALRAIAILPSSVTASPCQLPPEGEAFHSTIKFGTKGFSPWGEGVRAFNRPARFAHPAAVTDERMSALRAATLRPACAAKSNAKIKL